MYDEPERTPRGPARRPSWWRRMLDVVSGYAGGTRVAELDDDAAGPECRSDARRHRD